MNATVQVAKRAMRRVTDYRGWFVGMYLAAVPVSIGRILDWLSTNGLENSGLDIARGAGMNLKQLGITFVVGIGVNTLLYLKNKPLPDEIDRPITPAPFPYPINK